MFTLIDNVTLTVCPSLAAHAHVFFVRRSACTLADTRLRQGNMLGYRVGAFLRTPELVAVLFVFVVSPISINRYFSVHFVPPLFWHVPQPILRNVAGRAGPRPNNLKCGGPGQTAAHHIKR